MALANIQTLKDKFLPPVSFLVAISLFFSANFFTAVSPVLAQQTKKVPAGQNCDDNPKDDVEWIKLAVPLENGDNCIKEDTGKNNPIWAFLRSIIRFLSIGVGIVIVLMIVISGVQYITSSGNPDAAKAARKRLANAVVALLLFIFMAAILNFLIPGGILF